MLIDTHAHLWFDDFSDDLDHVIKNAIMANVTKIIVPGTNIKTSQLTLELAKKYPGKLYAAIGVHPEETTVNNFEFDHKLFEKIVKENINYIVAIGEIGIDLFTEDIKQKLTKQKELFKAQLLIASEMNLPVIIHTRNSYDEAWGVLNSLPKMPRGQFHCFSVDEEALKQVIEKDFYVSFGGNITWSKRVAKLVPLVPADRLLLETDSPLLVPRDSKGATIKQTDRNEPSNVRYLAKIIADIRGVTLSQIEEVTTANANRLYKL